MLGTLTLLHSLDSVLKSSGITLLLNSTEKINMSLHSLPSPMRMSARNTKQGDKDDTKVDHQAPEAPARPITKVLPTRKFTPVPSPPNHRRDSDEAVEFHSAADPAERCCFSCGFCFLLAITLLLLVCWLSLVVFRSSQDSPLPQDFFESISHLTSLAQWHADSFQSDPDHYYPADDEDTLRKRRHSDDLPWFVKAQERTNYFQNTRVFTKRRKH